MINVVFDAIRKLLKNIDPLIVQVKRCADSADTINSLWSEKQIKLSALNSLLATSHPQKTIAQMERAQQLADRQREIDEVQGRIDKLSQPFSHASENLRSFIADLRDVLACVPVDLPRLQGIRKEIERLSLLTYESTRGLMPMRDSHRDLLKLKFRLIEALVGPPERTDGNRQRTRRRIVSQVQRELGCNNREALADCFHVDSSAIRAAIRGDRDHSGPAAEQKILEACKKHLVDTSGW